MQSLSQYKRMYTSILIIQHVYFHGKRNIANFTKVNLLNTNNIHSDYLTAKLNNNYAHLQLDRF